MRSATWRKVISLCFVWSFPKSSSLLLSRKPLINFCYCFLTEYFKCTPTPRYKWLQYKLNCHLKSLSLYLDIQHRYYGANYTCKNYVLLHLLYEVIFALVSWVASALAWKTFSKINLKIESFFFSFWRLLSFWRLRFGAFVLAFWRLRFVLAIAYMEILSAVSYWVSSQFSH